MSSNDKTTERLAQKLRTRAALLDAARSLVADGIEPTIAEVADAAQVSRATAYRYFPTQEALLVEVPLDEAAPTVESLFAPGAPGDAEDRAALVQNALYDLARDNESQFRVFLRASLTRALRDPERQDPLRGARRTALLAEALAPLTDELTAGEIDRLIATLSILAGVESMIALHDVVRLAPEVARPRGGGPVSKLVRAASPAGPAPPTDYTR